MSIPSPRSAHAHVCKYVQSLKYLLWWACCLAWSLGLFAFIGGTAWGQATTGATTNIEDAAMAVPTGLVQRIGDRSVILHWDTVDDSDVSGYQVYRAPSPTAPLKT